MQPHTPRRKRTNPRPRLKFNPKAFGLVLGLFVLACGLAWVVVIFSNEVVEPVAGYMDSGQKPGQFLDQTNAITGKVEQ